LFPLLIEMEYHSIPVNFQITNPREPAILMSLFIANRSPQPMAS